MYDLILAPEAGRFFDDASEGLQNRLNRAFEQLRLEPHFHPNIKRLKGEFAGYSRFRVGDWRVVYRVDEKANLIVVTKIGHRREIYE